MTREELKTEKKMKAELAARSRLLRVENTCKAIRQGGFKYRHIVALQNEFKGLMGTLNRSDLVQF